MVFYSPPVRHPEAPHYGPLSSHAPFRHTIRAAQSSILRPSPAQHYPSALSQPKGWYPDMTLVAKRDFGIEVIWDRENDESLAVDATVNEAEVEANGTIDSIVDDINSL